MATKNQLKRELDALGIEYDAAASKEKLEALIPTNKEESGEPESEEETETETEEELESEVKTVDATGDVTKYSVFKGQSLVKVYNHLTHGKNFIALAEAYAERIGGTARPYIDPEEEAREKTVVNVVNKNGNLVRQFALSTHGKDYVKLADTFVEKHGEKKGLHIQK